MLHSQSGAHSAFAAIRGYSVPFFSTSRVQMDQESLSILSTAMGIMGVNPTRSISPRELLATLLEGGGGRKSEIHGRVVQVSGLNLLIDKLCSSRMLGSGNGKNMWCPWEMPMMCEVVEAFARRASPGSWQRGLAPCKFQ